MATLKTARDIYDFRCILCSETFKNPKVLPCLHSFCYSCLEELIRGHEQTLICPTCTVEIQVDPTGLDAFPANSFAINMLNILAIENPTNCSNCEDRELANSRCLDCVENLCTRCVTAHERIRQTKGHKIITFEELQNNAVHDALKCHSFCKTHDREILKYFCETCDEAICRDCAICEHRDHNYMDLKEAVKLHRNGVTNLLDNAKRKIPVIKLALKEIAEVKENLNQRRISIAHLIKSKIDLLIKYMEERKTQLLSQLDEIYLEKESVINDQQDELELDLDNFHSSCEFVENMMNYGNEAEVMTVKRFMTKRLRDLCSYQPQTEPEENDVIEFFFEDAPLKDEVDKFGKLSTSNTFPLFCVAKGDGLHQATMGHTTEFKVITKDRFGNFIPRGGDALSVKVTDSKGTTTNAEVLDYNNGTYSVTYKVKSKGKHLVAVYIRDKAIQNSPFEVNVSSGIDIEKIGPMLTKFGSGGVTSSLAKDDSYEPWGLVCNKDGDIIVTDHSNHKVQVFDVNGKLLHQFGVRGKDDGEIWYPTGIAVDKYSNIYVADHGNHRIQAYTGDGKFIRKYGSRGTGDGQLKGPCGICIDRENRLIVTDRDNHRVQIFDLDGKFLLAFGGYGIQDGKMNSPRHVSVTMENNIVISDTNNYRVQVFDRNGKFISKFGSKGTLEAQFMCPSGIGLDGENNIVIADFRNANVQIFSEEGNFLKVLGSEGSISAGIFSKPTGLFVSSSGNILVADRGTHKIYLF
ncbi:E3 ubiquitin-protein ligase TRIM71 [Hydra vulgaris]|uniref:E3 ubiquitin-protein ligase TRIM71 n=1 Tax=Hydra vulgaris TaxID=6087 RepID=A0ABM4BDL3_HYDVU